MDVDCPKSVPKENRLGPRVITRTWINVQVKRNRSDSPKVRSGQEGLCCCMWSGNTQLFCPTIQDLLGISATGDLVEDTGKQDEDMDISIDEDVLLGVAEDVYRNHQPPKHDLGPNQVDHLTSDTASHTCSPVTKPHNHELLMKKTIKPQEEKVQEDDIHKH